MSRTSPGTSVVRMEFIKVLMKRYKKAPPQGQGWDLVLSDWKLIHKFVFNEGDHVSVLDDILEFFAFVVVTPFIFTDQEQK